MRAGVMIANISWNTKCAAAGMCGAHGPGVSPTWRRANQFRFPMNPPAPPEKASEYPTNTQIVVTTPIEMKLCIMIARKFFLRTRPP
jgi:hypothetical protein